MFDISQFRTSKELELNGVWRDLGPDARILLARLGNPEFSKMFSEMVQPYADAGTKVPPEFQEEVTAKCLAKTIVLDWEGIYDGKEALPYSHENAVRVLSELKDLRELVIKLAGVGASYKAKNDEEIEGNLDSASVGLSTSETS